METVRWVAHLSDGSNAVEHVGSYQIEPGARKPWVRLTQFLAENDLYLTSLELEVQDLHEVRTIHLPMREMNRFGFEGKNLKPRAYAVAYLIEGELDPITGIFTQKEFIDVVTEYDNFEVHFIQSFNREASWVFVTEGHSSLAPTPPIKEG